MDSDGSVENSEDLPIKPGRDILLYRASRTMKDKLNWRQYSRTQLTNNMYIPPPSRTHSTSPCETSDPFKKISLDQYRARKESDPKHAGLNHSNTRYSLSSYSNSSKLNAKLNDPLAKATSINSKTPAAAELPDNNISTVYTSPPIISTKKWKKELRKKQNAQMSDRGLPITDSKKQAKPIEEPVILTLSSSDEEEDDRNGTQYKNNPQYDVICSKEPPLSSFKENEDTFGDEPSQEQEFRLGALSARVIRIGSYKFMPTEEVLLLGPCIKIPAPVLSQEREVAIEIPLQEIIKVLGCFDAVEPVIFIFIKPRTAARIRHTLEMNDKDGYYIDPCSQEQSQRRITLILKKLDAYTKGVLLKSLSNRGGKSPPLFEEIDSKEADTILVKTTITQVQSYVKAPETQTAHDSNTILIYPPPPSKGRISVTTDDYLCLGEEQFLNDVIIDFYLKWLLLGKLPEIHRQRTHVFSTFFYKRLTQKRKKTKGAGSATTADPDSELKVCPAEMRHARVQSWSKGVDIFEKDFIFVPINEKSHWFLAVICFPGLESPVRTCDGHRVPFPDAVLHTNRKSSRKRGKVELFQIPSVSDLEGSDRDEAVGDDDELDDFEEDAEPPIKKTKVEEIPSITPPVQPAAPTARQSIKRPCILIFDSLSGSCRSRIVATLREYLSVEHWKRKGAEKEFSKLTMPGTVPKVPQQMNYSDCGVYTLQYAESFFEKPIKDYSFPLNSLLEWFDIDIVVRKREAIANLIKALMEKGDKHIALPQLNALAVKGNATLDSSIGLESSSSTSPRRNELSLESASLELNDFKPITELNPYQANRKINFNVSSKNFGVKRALQGGSSNKKQTSSDISIFNISNNSSSSSISVDSKKMNCLQLLSVTYSDSDPEDDIFIKGKDTTESSETLAVSEDDLFNFASTDSKSREMDSTSPKTSTVDETNELVSKIESSETESAKVSNFNLVSRVSNVIKSVTKSFTKRESS